MSRLLDVSSAVPNEPLPPSQVLDRAPRAGARLLTTLAGVDVGVWEMTPGTATDVEVDEVFVVVSGSATVTFADGSLVDLAPGSVVRLNKGERTVWTVHETLRKLYVA